MFIDGGLTYSSGGGLVVAALAGHLESDIVGSVALDLNGTGREVVEVLVQQLERWGHHVSAPMVFSQNSLHLVFRDSLMREISVAADPDARKPLGVEETPRAPIGSFKVQQLAAGVGNSRRWRAWRCQRRRGQTCWAVDLGMLIRVGRMAMSEDVNRSEEAEEMF